MWNSTRNHTLFRASLKLVEYAKRSLFRTANGIFGKVGRSATVEVVLQCTITDEMCVDFSLAYADPYGMSFQMSYCFLKSFRLVVPWLMISSGARRGLSDSQDPSLVYQHWFRAGCRSYIVVLKGRKRQRPKRQVTWPRLHSARKTTTFRTTGKRRFKCQPIVGINW